jgi:4-amino-4-deoxychorismate lyase
MLEGPTFAVGWVVDSVLETPGLELGVLDSITRRMVLEAAAHLGITVVEGVWGLDRLGEAEEAMAWSTIREVQAVTVIGERSWEVGPMTDELAKAFAQRIG